MVCYGPSVTQAILPQRSAFVGTAVDARYSAATTAGSAWFSGWILAAAAPRERLARWLPADLALAERAVPRGEHPVVLLFGRHTGGTVHWFGRPTPMGPPYDEALVLIPYVRARGSGWLHLYAAHMYATFPPAVWSGNLFYAYGKEQASVSRDAAVGVVTASDGRRCLEIAVGAPGPWVAGLAFDGPGWAALRDVVTMPVVGRRRSGGLVYSAFRWSWDEARVRPIAIDRLAIDPDPGIEALRLDGPALVGFEIDRMRWRLGWPAPGRAVPAAPLPR